MRWMRKWNHIFVVAWPATRSAVVSLYPPHFMRMHAHSALHLVWGAENICTYRRCCWIRPRLITNYTGAFCLVRCAHAIPQYALLQTNSFAAALLLLFLAELLLFGVRRARGKIYDFIFWCSMPLIECCVLVRSRAQCVFCLMGVCARSISTASVYFIYMKCAERGKWMMDDPGFSIYANVIIIRMCAWLRLCVCVKEEFGCYIKWRDLRCVVWELIARACCVPSQSTFQLSRIGSMLKVETPAWLANYIKCESPLKLMRCFEKRLSFPRKSGVMSSFMDGDLLWESHLVCVSALPVLLLITCAQGIVFIYIKDGY
jgi:hypothetical protein